MYLAVLACALVLALSLTRWYVQAARAKTLFEGPGQRAMGGRMVPVGGGLVVLVATVLAWLSSVPALSLSALGLLGGVAALAAVSALDDRKLVPWWLPFLCHVVVVAALLALMPGSARIWPEAVPLILERVLIAGLWIGFINALDFLDGLDGLSGAVGVVLALGISALGYWLELRGETLALMLALGGAVAGFLWWNWAPAKVFLGDVGTVPMGLILGYGLLELALAGYAMAGFAVGAYVVGDVAATGARRLWRGEAVLYIHNQHFYQRAAAAGLGDEKVVVRIVPGLVALCAAGAVSVFNVWVGLGLVVLIVAGMLGYLHAIAEKRL